MTIQDEILNEVKSLENRLRCYHEGKHGRSTVKMHVELKTIERIKEKLEQSRGSGQVDAVVMEPVVAKKIILARDAFIENDYDEVWHQLYSIASPDFDKMSDSVWTELEELAKKAP